ncbi:MAG: TonB family protein, partial [Bacteroidota bacterium]
TPPPPPLPPPPPNIGADGEEIFKTVERMPMFPGCEHIENYAERKQCADRKMLEFIYENIEYPKEAYAQKVEGTCVVQFVVNKNGQVCDAKVVRDIGAGCGAESLRVVELMKEKGIQWNPSTHHNRLKFVQINLPVKFRIPPEEKER